MYSRKEMVLVLRSVTAPPPPPAPPRPLFHCRCNWEGQSAFSSSCQLSKTGCTNCGKCVWDQTCSNDPRRADTKPMIKIVNEELKKKNGKRAVLLAGGASSNVKVVMKKMIELG